MPEVLLHTGPGRSSRAARMDALFQQYWGRAVLLLPTAAAAMRRRERLVLESGKPGLWGQGVFEFTQFAVALLEAEGLRVYRLADIERRLLLESCLDRLIAEGALPEAFSGGAALRSPGVLRHLLRVITQIKQAGIEPDEFRARAGRRGLSPADAAVAAAYGAYQDALKAARAYDVPGLYWEAEERCKAIAPRFLESVDALLLDGFDDFTPSQFRFIASLAPHAKVLAFGLNHDPAPERQDRYRLSAEAAARIQKTFAVAPVHHESPAPTRDHEFAADAFLWRDPPQLPAGLERDFEMRPCADLTHEIEFIGRRIKTLIRGGVAPGNIAVVFRGLGEVAGTVRAVFREFSIPLALQHRPPLAQSGLGGFLLRFFEAAGAWERETVLEVLRAPWMAPPAEAGAFSLLARAARVVEGREEWTRRVGALARRLATKEGAAAHPLLERMPNAPKAVEALASSLERLAKLDALLPRTAAPDAFARAVEALLDALDIEACIETMPGAEAAHAERNALAALRSLLVLLARAEPGSGPPWTRADWLRRFEEGLAETSYGVPAQRNGVVCIDAPSIRNLQFDYVFFAALNDGMVPAPPPSNAFYSDPEIEAHRGAGIALEGKRHHGDRERALFHHVLESARERLVLTWHLQKGNGQEASRSPFLAELAACFEERGGVLAPPPAPGAFLPMPDEAASLRDLRIAAYRNPGALREAGAARGEFAALEHAVRVEQSRQDFSPFGPHDGVLTGAAAGRAAEAFGAKHQFSANQIERYLSCPFRFFAERVLQAAETETPEAEFDPRLRGALLHDILQAFHAAHAGLSVPEIPAVDAAETLHNAIGAAFAKATRRDPSAPLAVVAAEKERMTAVLDRYLEIERAREEADWKPSHFETSFGQERGGGNPDAGSRPEPYVFQSGAGPVLLAGRIDRIDRNGNRVRVIDYKSGGLAGPAELRNGLNVQLALYARVVAEHLFPDVSCREAWYLQVGRSNRRSALADGYGKPFPDLGETVRTRVGESVTGIRAGSFPPTPSATAHCDSCPYNSTCRHEAARVERKSKAVSAK